MLDVAGLVAGYGPADALHGVDLRVAEGETVAVLGPNGAGKTTLLRTLVGLLRPRQGTVTYDGERLDGRAPEDILARGVALVPEERGIFGGLTVLENLRMGAYRERSRRVVDERLTAAFERFPVLADRRGQDAGTLSGGQQQQLAIARALMSGPRLLLLDEPSLGLAPVVIDVVTDLVASLSAEGLTVLLVEQNAFRALELADRVYVLAAGAVRLEGPAEQVGSEVELAEAYLGGDVLGGGAS